MTTILVCGSRSWRDLDMIRQVLRTIVTAPAETRILHGAAMGADLLAALVATELGCAEVVAMPAEWDRYGRSAGIRRNLAMLDARPAWVVAFWNGRSSGTAHTIGEAKRRRIPVMLACPSPAP